MSLYKRLEPSDFSTYSAAHCTKRVKNSAIAILSAGAIAVTTLFVSSAPSPVHADEIGPLSPYERALEALRIRSEAAESNFSEPLPEHPDNGDEDAFSGPDVNPAKEFEINSYTKGLPHNNNGIVKQNAYKALIDALKSGDPADFKQIPMGVGDLGLRNPQAAYTYLMEGKDPHSYTMPAAPAFSSAQQASEAIEVLWQAITRDISYSRYEDSHMIKKAAKDMSRFSDFRGPKDENGDVTPSTLFRGVGNKENIGPYISQFLLQPIPYGATKIEQKYNVPVAGNDHLTNYDEWLHIQNGGGATGITSVKFQDNPHYVYNGRAMAQFVLQDFVFQAYLGAARIIRGYGSSAYDINDPYKGSESEARSPLFGNNHALDWLGRVSMGSQNVAWFQKWLVHRRARPEVFFGRVHNHLTKPGINYPIHEELFGSPALDIVYKRNGTYLLPTATPVGSPLHPTYPAGHAVMAGAAVTMLKAFFNEDYVIENPVTTNDDGTALVPYVAPAGEPPLTIESELNKLASNISLGRDIAGVHYRTDGDLGIALGEKYGISILEELVETYNEDFEGFFLRKFDGTEITISKNH
jgi:hypothetical protein